MKLKKYLLFLLLFIQTTLYAWTPDKFGISCESYSNLIEYSNNNPITDIDCMPKKKRKLLEKYLAEILQSLKALGFNSPKGKSLGPVVEGYNSKDKVVEIYTGTSGLADTAGACLGSGERRSEPYSYISINEKLFNELAPYRAFVFLGHELIHVIQHSQKFYLKSNACHKIPLWVMEGTADAIIYDLTYKRFNYAPRAISNIHKNFYGLRHYDYAFAYTFPDAYNYVENYRSSSFWKYLKSHYYKNNFKFIARYLNVLPKNVGQEDWLAWLNQLLISDKYGPKKPLYLVYPEFIAHYANWGKYKYKKLINNANEREKKWLKGSFSGCKTITLSPSNNLKKTLFFELEPISAQCFTVAVKGLGATNNASIKIMAYDSSKKKLDNLHISTAYAEFPYIETKKSFNCYKDVPKYQASKTCVDTPIMGDIPRKKAFGKHSDGLRLVKVWRSKAQKFDSVKKKNLYILSHVPLKPSDKKHTNRKKQKVELTIALDFTKFKTKGNKASKKTVKKSMKKGSRQVSSEVGLMGATGTQNSMDIPMMGAEGGMNLSSMMNGNEGLSKLLMGMNIPDVTASLRGIHQITLKDFETNGDEVKHNLILNLIFEEPIKVGSIGKFKANIMGSVGEEDEMIKVSGTSVDMSNLITNVGDEASATVEILEYSKEMLHIKAQGSYCEGRSATTGECLNVEDFSAEIFKPLGLAYGSGGLKSMDSPGMKIYRKNHYNRIQSKGKLSLPSGFENIDAKPSGSDTKSEEDSEKSSSSETNKCTCSCDEFKTINKKMEEAGDVQPENSGALVGCMMSCMMQYMKCEDE